jgi:TonB family protein
MKSPVSYLLPGAMAIAACLIGGSPNGGAHAQTKARPAVKRAPVSNPGAQAYCAQVWNRISHKWFLPDGNNRVTLTAVLDAQGNPEDMQATSSPKNDQAEAAAVQAFNDARPYGAIPKLGTNKAKMTVTFVSKADPHGESSSSGQVRIDPLADGGGAGDTGNSEPPAQTPAQPPAQAPAQAPAQPTSQAPAQPVQNEKANDAGGSASNDSDSFSK